MKKHKEPIQYLNNNSKNILSTTSEYNPTCKKISRRHFLAEGTMALVGSSLMLKSKASKHKGFHSIQTSEKPGAIPGPWPGKVCEVSSPEVFSNKQIDQQSVKAMLEKGLKELTGKNSLAEAWSVFIKPDDTVGIKINCATGPLCLCASSKELVNEIINGLKQVGIKEDNIIVWDRGEYEMVRCGWKVNRHKPGVKYYGPEIKLVDQEDMNGYDSECFIESEIGAVSRTNAAIKSGKRSYFAEIMSRKITKLINVPVLKDHASAGVTLCLKNLGFGLVNNTARFHPAPYYCAPIMVDVCLHPMVRKKTVLHILDALNGLWNKGPDTKPDYIWQYKSLIFGTDPVAIDRIGCEIIENKRREMGAQPIGNRALHIAECGRAGLGVSDPSKIQHRKITI
jgi:uncharacterized protein (DUF362 family)